MSRIGHASRPARWRDSPEWGYNQGVGWFITEDFIVKYHFGAVRCRGQSFHWWLPGLVSAAVLTAALPAAAEIRELRGRAETLIIQRLNGEEVQRDFSQESLHGTTSALPLLSQARLEKIEAAEVLGAGQGVALLHRLPAGYTDAGMDLGAFSEDSSTSWYGSTAVSETRVIVLNAADLPGARGPGDTAVVPGRIRLSGIMLITAMADVVDLSGTEVRLNVSVTRRDEQSGAAVVLDGEVRLVGGPGRDVRVERATGVFAPAPPAVAALPELTPEMPIVRAVLFTGQELQYDYSATAGQPFELELNTRVQVFTAAAGVGAAAAFGNPVDGLPAILQKTRRADAARRLIEVVRENVDTTGVAYAPPSALPVWPGLCGVLGLEGLAVPLLWLPRWANRRRTRE